MIFTLISTLKDSAEALIRERQAGVQAVKDREAAKVEEEENRKFHGTAVTRESFLEWRDGFRREIREEEERRREEKEGDEKRKKGAGRDEKKLTGKQLWERGLAGQVEEEEEGEDAVEGLERLKVGA